MRTRNRLVVFAAVGITFVLHSALQWYSWALADSINHRYPLPFTFLSFPVIWLAPRSLDSFEPLMALNSAIWAGIAGLLLMRVLDRRRARRAVSDE
jgi:hypothetical protein